VKGKKNSKRKEKTDEINIVNTLPIAGVIRQATEHDQI
jgi:hypothetical protein